MDGGGIAIAQDRIVTAWRREHEIFLDSPGEKEVGIGEGVDVALAAARGHLCNLVNASRYSRALAG